MRSRAAARSRAADREPRRARRCSARWRSAWPHAIEHAQRAGRRGRHRRRQDLRLPRADAAERRARAASAPPPRACRTSSSCATCRACATRSQLPVTVALLKGRASYLCLHRLEPGAPRRAPCPTAGRCARSPRSSSGRSRPRSGDLAELDGLDERRSVIPLVTSSRENCLGSECPEYRALPRDARRGARRWRADLVVVNHHLFFADMALRDSGVAELLPSVEVAVFDEAHQLAETGVQFLGTTLGTAQVIDFARDLLGAGLQQARGLAAVAGARGRLRPRRARAAPRRAGELRELRGARQAALGRARDAPAFVAALRARRPRRARRAAAALDHGERAGARLRPAARARRRSSPSSRPRFGEPAARRRRCAGSTCRRTRRAWSSRRSTFATRCGEQMRSGAARPGSSRRPRSATTSACRWFTEPAGLEDARMLRVGSPFDYARPRAASTCRASFPKPNEPGHADAVARAGGALRARARRPHLRADDHAARAAGRSAQQLRAAFDARRRRDRGAGAGPTAQAPADAAVPRRAARRCWSARRASGRASTCPATRCSAW